MEFDMTAAAVAVGMYILCMIGVWNPYSRNIWGIKTSIGFSIVMLPIAYVITYMVINKG